MLWNNCYLEQTNQINYLTITCYMKNIFHILPLILVETFSTRDEVCQSNFKVFIFGNHHTGRGHAGPFAVRALQSLQMKAHGSKILST